MKILYIQTNMTRLPQFQMQTSIFQSKNAFIVEKKAVSLTGAAHISELVSNHQLITQTIPQIKLPRILRKTKGFIQYEYIEGVNFQVDLEKALFDKNYQLTNEIIINQIEIIKSLPYKKVTSKSLRQFADFLSIPKTQINNLKNNQYALKPAPLDLKLANLIRDKRGKLYLVDTEWICDFYIPIKFIIWRMFFNLLINLQSLIQASANTNFPLYKLSDFYHCPTDWWKIFSFSIPEYKMFAEWEVSFQKYVTGLHYDSNNAIYSHIISETEFETIDSYSTKITQIESLGKTIEFLNKQVKLKNQEEEIQRKVISLEADLKKIKSAKFYKLWQGFNHIKKKIF